MSKKKNINPMYFSYLEIENIKCFGGRQILDLKNTDGTISPWTMILGNNGLGKTTLLKCLAWMDTAEETDEVKKKDAKIAKGKIAVKGVMDALDSDAEYEQLARIGKSVLSMVKAQFAIGVKLGEVPKKQQLLEYSIDIKTEGGKLQDVIPKLTGVSEFNAPYIYGYGASRHMELKNSDRLELTDPVSNLFSESGELLDASEQLLFQDYAALQENPKGKETVLLQKIKQLLVDLLPGIERPEDVVTYAKTREVKIRTRDGEVPLNNLSLGYKTMVAWTVDLALKMLHQNPDSENPLEEPAIVIIDEVDLHLHPKWQRIIQEKLTSTFKKTQFICTAHSPFMAQSSENENLCVLSRQESGVVIENEPHIVRGWRLGQIVTSELFGLNTDRGPDAEKDISERRQLLDKPKLSTNEQKQLDQVSQKINSLPSDNPEDDLLMAKIRKATEILASRGIITDDQD